MPDSSLDRRSFLSIGAGGALFCALAPGTTRSDVAAADRSAARLAYRKPKLPPLSFPSPRPAAGGRVRTSWVQARPVVWDIAPHVGRDEWMKMPIRGRTRFRTLAYQLMSAGFARPLGPPSIPGPTLTASVGDLLEVHFRNADRHFHQALTMHPHGVRYNPDHDGSYLSDFTRAGGFVAPGETFTYRWEATPDAVGAWPYHDHGPNHTINTLRGLFGAIVVYPRGERPPDRQFVLVQHAFPPQVTGRDDQAQCVNGRVGAGNTPTLHARVGEDVAFYVYGGDGEFHTFHIHGHRWRDPSGALVDNPGFGPHETVIARFREDNPGRWLYHCHVFSHQDAGMAGWYIVSG